MTWRWGDWQERESRGSPVEMLITVIGMWFESGAKIRSIMPLHILKSAKLGCSNTYSFLYSLSDHILIHASSVCLVTIFPFNSSNSMKSGHLNTYPANSRIEWVLRYFFLSSACGGGAVNNPYSDGIGRERHFMMEVYSWGQSLTVTMKIEWLRVLWKIERTRSLVEVFKRQSYPESIKYEMQDPYLV
ncbi:hypothetical protein FGO68_gene6306 [Halteria grandinella]|uniref:Uncharacterized protein n=1 Tax=Halteria grandinella TaxID=5974 RepID=A0A8J8NTN4_HALGN|nr:hypothetical protein FGO68_gene6306 [Halteria grandinella]